MTLRALLAALFGALLCTATVARADELADFERAREAYDSQRYELAVQRFEALVGGEIPAIRNPTLVEESRKYLGAAYLFVGRRPDAERQFARLVQAQPQYELDAVLFPREVVAVFEEVRTAERVRREEEARRIREQEERRNREQVERLMRERVRLERLIQLAEEQVTLVENSRILATLPFGAGQYQNGDIALAAFFSIGEGLLLVANVVAVISYFSLPVPANGSASPDLGRLQDVAQALRVTTWASGGALIALALAGIIEAHVNFVPGSRRVGQRTIPAELLESLTVGIGPGTLELRGSF